MVQNKPCFVICDTTVVNLDSISTALSPYDEKARMRSTHPGFPEERWKQLRGAGIRAPAGPVRSSYGRS